MWAVGLATTLIEEGHEAARTAPRLTTTLIEEGHEAAPETTTNNNRCPEANQNYFKAFARLFVDPPTHD